MDFDFYKGKKVLVTGSTGFKGSWLCLWLHALGAEVYGYALKPSEQDNFHLCRLDGHIHQKYADVRDREQMLSYFKEVQPDIAFHLAAQAVVLDSYIDPFHNFEVNLMGTVNFLDAVRFTPSVKAAVNITSDKCYQNNDFPCNRMVVYIHIEFHQNRKKKHAQGNNAEFDGFRMNERTDRRFQQLAAHKKNKKRYDKPGNVLNPAVSKRMLRIRFFY